MYLILRWLITAFSVWVAVMLIPGLDHSGNWVSLLAIAAVLGLVNAFIRPFVVFLSCPCIAVTLGLFILIINALMLGVTVWLSEAFGLGLTSEGFLPVFLGALVISVVSGILNLVLTDD